MKLSVVVPARNEEGCLEKVIVEVVGELSKENIENEIIIVNDNSTDSTPQIIEKLIKRFPNVRVFHRSLPSGFGRAVKDGLQIVSGDVVIIAMGDASDDPGDIVKYFRKIEEGYDCVFGSRFIRGAIIKDYPSGKLILNRMANTFIRYLFSIRNNDITNAFKAYRVKVIRAVMPLISNYFNITVEIPLKAIVRGFSCATIPISWHGRESGVSKYRLSELQRKYLFSLLYVWLEKILLKDEIKNRG